MVTTLASNTNHRCSGNPLRPPSLRPDSDNAPPRRPKAREVSSRYMSLSTSSSSSNSSSSTNTTSFSVTSGSSISSWRCQSPMRVHREAILTPMSSVKERAVSAERRRPEASTKTSNAVRMLTTSTRSLSVSFHGDPSKIQVNKVERPPISAGTPGGLRKCTPERRKARENPVRDRTERDTENLRLNDQQHRWPGSLRGQNSSIFTRSLDFGAERGKLNGFEHEFKQLRNCIGDENSGNNGDKLDLKKIEVKSDLAADSVSLQRTPRTNMIQLKGRPDKIVVPSRIGQELNNRRVKVLDPSSPVSNKTPSRNYPSSKVIVHKKFPNDSHLSSPNEVYPRWGLSPRVASPSKASTRTGALFNGMATPARPRNDVGNFMKDNYMCSTPSLLFAAADVMRGKLGKSQIVDAHDLRLLQNRQLQWRLANAKVENALLVQKQAAERSLYNAWLSTSKLQHSVKSKRTELQLLSHNLKVYSILKQQELHLEKWDLIDSDHCDSLSRIIKALLASTIRLPVVSGARADVKNVQEAISAAVDVMQAMTSTICSLLTKVERMNLLMSEVADLSVRERNLLDEIKDFLSTTFIPLQVIYCSLKAHELQLQVTLPKKM